jgi:HEAT repeat protein
MNMKTVILKFFAFLLFSVFLSGCVDGLAIPSSVKTTGTKEIAENFTYPTPASTLPELIAGLSSDDAMVRKVSIDALGKFGDEAVIAIPQLRENLYYDEWSMVRISAAIAISQLGANAKDAAPDLISVIENDPHPGVVYYAVITLSDIGDASIVPLLANILYCDSKFYEGRHYSQEGCLDLAINSAEAIGKLTGEYFTDAGIGAYTLNDENIPLIVLDAREWWEDKGQYIDWNEK